MSSKMNTNNMSSEESMRMDNAHRIAEMVKNSNFPILKCPASGSKKYFNSMSEKERARQLKNPEEMNSARVNGKSVAQLFKTVPRFQYQERPTFKGYWRFLGMLEEKERQRRLSDHDEAVHRRMNALNISEGIRTQGTIIRARFVKRSHKNIPAQDYTTWNNISAAAHLASILTNKVIHDAIEVATPTAEVAAHALSNAFESARNAVTGVPAMASKAVHSAVETVTPHDTGKPSAISSLLNRAFAIKNSLINSVQQAVKLQPTAAQAAEKLMDSNLLEEEERQRRISEDPINGCARSNARKMSQLLAHARFPTLRGQKGYLGYTNAAEHHERLRRLANKSECECHRMNASKIASMISQLGWPFFQDSSAPLSRSMTLMNNLAEEERRRRMSDEKGMWVARHNAKKVAGLIRDATFPEQSKKAFMLSHTRKLEDKERKYRANNCDMAVHNAHRQAQLIADIGAPFYIAKAKADVKEIVRQKIDRMEAEERMDRMNNAQQQQMAQKKAHKVAKMFAQQAQPENKEWPKSKQDRQMSQEFARDVAHIQNTDLNLLQENERKSRMADKDMAHQTRANANKVAGMMKRNFGKNSESGFGITANKPFPLSAVSPSTISPPSKQLAPYIRENIMKAQPALAQPALQPTPLAQQPAQQQQPAIPTQQQPLVSAPAFPFTRVQFKPEAIAQQQQQQQSRKMPPTPHPGAPQRFGLKSSDNLPSTPTNDADIQAKLFQSVRAQYQQEMVRAEREQEKVNKLSGRSHGPFGRFRLQKHEANMAKYRDNAKRHDEWLRANVPAASAAHM